MARIRTIKPEFFTSLTIADLPLTARITFIGLWTHVDDDGRCVDEPRLVRAAVWPLDDRLAGEVDADLGHLHDAGLIYRYEVDGRRYLAVRNWREHQRIDKPKPSKLPAPEDGMERRPTPPVPPTDRAPTCDNADFPEASKTNPGDVPDAAAPSPEPVPVGKEQGRDQGREQGRGERAGAGASDEPAPTPSALKPPQTIHADVDDSFDMAPIDRDGFALNEGMRRWAVQTVPHLDVEQETALFVAHFRAEGTNRPNWPAEWQKWMIRSSKWASERAAKAAAGTVVQFPGGHRPSTTDQRVQQAHAAAASVAAQLAAMREQEQQA